jgi:hypothetical protein
LSVVITYTLKLVGLRHPPGRNHAIPLLSPLLGMDVENVCCDEPRRDAVDAAEIDPFDGQAFGELDDRCFRRVVLSSLAPITNH